MAGLEVEAFLARGGMAVVYRARDLRLGQTVALKVIAPELAQHEEFRQRFTRESELAASLDHPNVIPIYAAGEFEDLLYLVMRYVPGEDLGTVLAERKMLPPREVLPIFTQVAGALDAAHAHNLVHRDVKPGNILLSGDASDLAQRHVYLSDFGFTKRLSSLTGLTTAGHFIGTIQYVSPEQVANRPQDHRSDIYSLGCVIYESFAGEPPFVSEDDAALLWAHLTDSPPLVSDRRPDLPANVDEVLQRAMAKDPDDRQQDCRTLMGDLRSAFRSPGQTRPPPSGGTSIAQRTDPGPATQVTPSPSAPAPQRAGTPNSPADVEMPAGPARGSSARSVDMASTPTERPSAHVPVSGKPQEVRRRVKLTALVLALCLLVAGISWFIFRTDAWETYSGTQTEAAVKLERPKSWIERPHQGQFFVFSPTDASGMFIPPGNWSPVAEIANRDPRSLVGAYVNSTYSVDIDGITPVSTLIEDQFKGSAEMRATQAPRPPGSSIEMIMVKGTMNPPGAEVGPDVYFELVLLPARANASTQAEVLLFCHVDDRQHYADTFERVINSLRPA